MAQDLGLHQSCDDWNLPEMEKQMRKRIWWSLYIMDRFNSALFGKPLTIAEEVVIEKPYPRLHLQSY
jgi:Fungal specific transcription factor domain